MTLSNAKKRLKSKLSILYTGLTSDENSTMLDVSLGNLRSIKVNVVGQVELPGTYTLSALSTVFNALYASGGIAENGTLRKVRVYRNNSLLSEIDLYEYLLNGDATQNVMLNDEDVIIVSPFTNRIELNGAVKAPGFFEVLELETIENLLNYSGGFMPNANTSTVLISRIINGEKKIANVNRDQFGIFTLQAGDVITVREVTDNYANRIIVKGAVYNPGQYQLVSPNELSKFLTNEVGLRSDASPNEAIILRTLQDLTTEIIRFNLGQVLNGETELELKKEDVITILSRSVLSEEPIITVKGQVNREGIIPFSKSITILDAMLLSDGLRERGKLGRVELARRKSDNSTDGLAEIMVYDLADKQVLASTLLEPFDELYFRRNPNYEVQTTVRIEGEVSYP